MTQTIQGCLHFAFPPYKPLANLLLELWLRLLGEEDCCLAVGMSDENGRFCLPIPPLPANPNAQIELRCLTPQHQYSPSGQLQEQHQLIDLHSWRLAEIKPSYDLGRIYIPFWEYNPLTAVPRAVVVAYGDALHTFTPGRSMAAVKQMAQLGQIRGWHSIIGKHDPSQPTFAQIQQDYPRSRTLELEESQPGLTRSDRYFADRMLNGMTASIIDRHPQHPEQFWIYLQWNSYEQNGEYALPNTDMRFELRDGELWPTQITLQVRDQGVARANAPLNSPQTFTPEAGEQWQAAKRIARVSAALSAELDAHLITTHLNVEQYALPLLRHVRRNPIRWLLFPHIREVTTANVSADRLLLGKRGFIPRASALTHRAINKRIEQTLGMLDWQGWQPRAPLCAGHRYAHAAQLYWQVLVDYVDRFFAQHHAEIVAQWAEIYRFSEELVDHSVPVFLCGYLRHALAQDDGWFAGDERMAGVIERVRGGATTAVSPITQSPIPDAADLANLKQACRYIIMHATFMHTWANNEQYADTGELRYSGIGLRWGDNGYIALETDDSILPTPQIASDQLYTSRLLSSIRHGYLMRNEDRDINPLFLRLLREKTADFERLGFPITTIQSRINI